ncbi:transcription factor-like 5 protein [Pelodytes ibericus]
MERGVRQGCLLSTLRLKLALLKLIHDSQDITGIIIGRNFCTPNSPSLGFSGCWTRGVQHAARKRSAVVTAPQPYEELYPVLLQSAAESVARLILSLPYINDYFWDISLTPKAAVVGGLTSINSNNRLQSEDGVVCGGGFLYADSVSAADNCRLLAVDGRHDGNCSHRQLSVVAVDYSSPEQSAPSSGPGGFSEGMINEQAMSFTTTDLNIVEMTEIEYTQLQQILYSHMEAQSSEGEIETKLNSSYHTSSSSSTLPQYQSTNITNPTNLSSSSSGVQNVHPVICQAPEASSSQSLGHSDFQELKMMMLSESNLPLSSGNQTEKTPVESGKEPSGYDSMRLRYATDTCGTNKENENLVPVSEARSKSAVRVRLEDRFNKIQTDIPRCQESQESGVTVNNLVTFIRHPPQLMGVQQQSKCTTLLKNKASAGTTAVQFTYPVFASGASSTGNGSSSQNQTNSPASCLNSCPLLDAAKHQEISLPRTFSFCYQQETESTKQNVGTQNKSLPDQVWIKVGEALCKQAINKRSRSRGRQVEATVERKVLSDIQNITDSQSIASSWPSTHGIISENTATSQQPAGTSQRREKHNRMERDRRRRIRICCDDLNRLVPFCNADTDKATTLQWTTAFLKYIQERHADSLKKEFESVFCGKTGRRLKVNKGEVLRPGLCQESTQSSAPDIQLFERLDAVLRTASWGFKLHRSGQPAFGIPSLDYYAITLFVETMSRNVFTQLIGRNSTAVI